MRVPFMGVLNITVFYHLNNFHLLNCLLCDFFTDMKYISISYKGSISAFFRLYFFCNVLRAKFFINLYEKNVNRIKHHLLYIYCNSFSCYFQVCIFIFMLPFFYYSIHFYVAKSHVWIWELDCKDGWVLKNWCFWTVVLEKTLESPMDSKEIQPVHPKADQSWVFIGKDWCWSWNSNTLATSCEELNHVKRPWCWERLRAGGEGDDKGWDGWMASPTRWTRVWVDSGSWWWTGRPGVLQFMGLQRVGHDWATELNWNYIFSVILSLWDSNVYWQRQSYNCDNQLKNLKSWTVSFITNKCVRFGTTVQTDIYQSFLI